MLSMILAGLAVVGWALFARQVRWSIGAVRAIDHYRYRVKVMEVNEAGRESLRGYLIPPDIIGESEDGADCRA